MATIENELGTDIELDQGNDLETVDEASAEAPAEETAEEQVADESAEAAVEEPQVDESVSQETEDDVPTIEVHSADEKDNDLFASKQEGSQTSFFG